MKAKREAMEFADSVLALVPQLIDDAIEDRREHACWFAIYRWRRWRRALPGVRWIWRRLYLTSKDKCAANRELQTACARALAQLAHPDDLAELAALGRPAGPT